MTFKPGDAVIYAQQEFNLFYIGNKDMFGRTGVIKRRARSPEEDLYEVDFYNGGNHIVEGCCLEPLRPEPAVLHGQT